MEKEFVKITSETFGTVWNSITTITVPNLSVYKEIALSFSNSADNYCSFDVLPMNIFTDGKWHISPVADRQTGMVCYVDDTTIKVQGLFTGDTVYFQGIYAR